jgi:small subunit ribosomal protein S2
MTQNHSSTISPEVQDLYDAGLYFGYSTTKRHPSASKFIYDQKGRTDVFDLTKTNEHLNKAIAFIQDIVKKGGKILFVGGKNEAREATRREADSCAMPFVAGRWIGGALTNAKEIKKRVDRLEKLTADRESGALDKFTKKERVLIDREIANLNEMFSGLVSMKDKPAALLVIDSRHEDTAVREANQMGIPVIALSSSDCDFNKVQFPIPGNDATKKSISFILGKIASAINATPVGAATHAPVQK